MLKMQPVIEAEERLNRQTDVGVAVGVVERHERHRVVTALERQAHLHGGAPRPPPASPLVLEAMGIGIEIVPPAGGGS